MKKDHIATVVILDGCCTESLHRAETPSINSILKKGCGSFECKSIYPTATYSAHCSLITGKLPKDHGVVGNSFYDRAAGRIVDFDFQDINEFVTSKTLFEAVGSASVSIGEPITRGAELVISKTEVQRRSERKQNRYVMKRACEAIEEVLPKFAVMNFVAIDSLGEKHGPQSREVREALEEIDGLLEQLEEFLSERYEDHLLVLLADHGMTEVRENVRLDELLEGLDPIVCPSHRFAHVYVAREKVNGAKERLKSDGRFESVLSKKETKSINLFSERTGDLVVFAKKDFELGGRRLRGSHGGITPEELKVPLIVNKPEYLDLIEGASITVVPSIVLRYLLEKGAESLAKRKLRGIDPSHDWSHTERVLDSATALALAHKADVEAVRLACVLHDAERKVEKDHPSRAAELARNFLRSRALPQRRIKKIAKAIRLHHDRPEALKTLEEKILWDSDKLDALGFVGFIRCMQEAWHLGQGVEDAVVHLKKDTHEFANSMHFDETKKIALARSAEVKRVIELLNRR